MFNRERRRRPLRLLVWGTVIVVAALAWVSARPIGLSANNPTAEGTLAGSTSVENGADVVVVVSSSDIAHSAESERFDDIDFSWGWVETIQAEVGPVRIVEAEAFARIRLDDHRFVVITHSASINPEMATTVHRLEQFVGAGGALVLERPEGPLRNAFSADGRGGLRTPRAISNVEGVSEDVGNALAEMPLFTRFVGSTGPLTNAQTLLSMDGAPVVYRVRRGQGQVTTVDFNYGLALVSLQQGRPDDGMDLEPSGGREEISVADLVADPALELAEVPYADLLEHFMVNVVIGHSTPVVGFWPFPRGADGAVVLTHEVPLHADRTVWLEEWEAEHGASSTLLLGYGASLSDASSEALGELSADLGGLWERGTGDLTASRRSLGFAGLNPFERPASLRELQRRVRIAWGEREGLIGVRSLGGAWSDDWAGAFAEIAAAGFDFDVSYGSVGSDAEISCAYLHGTGRPFGVLDGNGLPLGLLELPILVPAAAEPDLERFEQLLRRSQRAHHQAIGVEIPALMFDAERPVALFDAWQSITSSARRREHVILSAGRLAAHHRLRTETTLTTTVVRDPTATEPDAAFRLEISVGVGEDPEPLWISLPQQVGERRFRELDHELRERQVRVFGQERLLLEIPADRPQTLRMEASYR